MIVVAHECPAFGASFRTTGAVAREVLGQPQTASSSLARDRLVDGDQLFDLRGYFDPER
jgi:hypothetical protein